MRLAPISTRMQRAKSLMEGFLLIKFEIKPDTKIMIKTAKIIAMLASRVIA